jgi:hypothetical protein
MTQACVIFTRVMLLHNLRQRGRNHSMISTLVVLIPWIVARSRSNWPSKRHRQFHRQHSERETTAPTERVYRIHRRVLRDPKASLRGFLGCGDSETPRTREFSPPPRPKSAPRRPEKKDQLPRTSQALDFLGILKTIALPTQA